jgi:hypothetical protein
MKRRATRWTALVISALSLMPLAAGESMAQAPDQTSAQSAPLLSPAELDQLTAPIALYSDPLLGSVLAAATYPLEVVEAARWRDDPANAALAGDQLAAALQSQSWDPSVKSLVAFPDVLRTMNGDLQWTERLGDAFLAQQADVMNSVQRLRQRAAAAGSLRSTPQQTVATEDDNVSIEPTSPDVVYTPYYDPSVVYGPWPWPDYPPFYFAIPSGIYFDGGLIGFGIGIGFVSPLWGWYGWDWPHHGFNVRPPRHGPGPGPGRPWSHDPGHRRGVPYRDPGLAARYGGAGSRQGFRGFAPSEAGRGVPARPAESSPARPAPAERFAPPERPAPTERVSPPERLPRTQPGLPVERVSPPARSAPVERASPPERVAPPTRAAPPAFESFGRGSQVRQEAGRGSASRSAPAPRASPPSPRGGGGRPRP